VVLLEIVINCRNTTKKIKNHQVVPQYQKNAYCGSLCFYNKMIVAKLRFIVVLQYTHYTDNKQTAPDDVKYKKKRKFEPKVLVWIAISESMSYIQKSRVAIDANDYINKCLRPNLVIFIKEHYNEDNHIFWPAHYAEATTRYLESQNIKLVPIDDDPPNVPQARPIENFWANLYLKVYDKG